MIEFDKYYIDVRYLYGLEADEYDQKLRRSTPSDVELTIRTVVLDGDNEIGVEWKDTRLEASSFEDAVKSITKRRPDAEYILVHGSMKAPHLGAWKEVLDRFHGSVG